MERYKLTEAARMLGVNNGHCAVGCTLGRPHIRSDSGRVFIPGRWVRQQTGELDTPKPAESIRAALYVRESCSENKAALTSRKEGLIRYAHAKGWQITEVVCEFGSGVNDECKRPHALLKQHDFDVLLAEHKDRLTRFGFKWFEALCPFKVEVVNTAENRVNDLMEDLIAIFTWFSARLYGQRRGRQKTRAALPALQESE